MRSKVSSILFAVLIWTALELTPHNAHAEKELSAHYRSARAGNTTHHQIGLRGRADLWEASIEYYLEDHQWMGFVTPIWRLNKGGFFQPHAFLGAGYGYWWSIVPGLGFHMVLGSFALRMDIYYYLSVGNFNEKRLQTFGLSYTF